MDTHNLTPILPNTENAKPVYAEKRYVTNDDYILRQIAGEYVLVSTADDSIFGNSMISLNETHAFLWKIYNEPLTLAEAIQKAHEEYDDPENIMEYHISQYLYQSVQFGLLVDVEE